MRRIGAFLFACFLLAAPAGAQFAGQAVNAGSGTGTANSQAINVANATSYANLEGVHVTFNPGATNTGATTLNASGLGAVAVLKPTTAGPVALAGQELVANQPVTVTYFTALNSGAGAFLIDGGQQNGAFLYPAGGHGSFRFSGAGTFTHTVSANVYWEKVTVVGAGGGGNFNNGIGGTVFQGQGGCSGSTVKGWVQVVPGQTITVVVGAQGNGAQHSSGADSTNGGNSSFASSPTLIAYGGVSGSNNDAGFPNACSAQTNGSGGLVIPGGAGVAPDPAFWPTPPSATYVGTFGVGGNSSLAQGGVDGQSGTLGSGGGGCSNAGCNGGNGGDGVVEGEW